MTRKYFVVVVGAVLGCVFLGLVFSRIELNRVIDVISAGFSFELFFMATLCYACFFLVKAIRWRMLLMSYLHKERENFEDRICNNPEITSLALLPYIMLGYAGNMVVPMQLGEAARGVLFCRHFRLNKTSVLSGIGVEKMLDILALVLILEVAFWFLLKEFAELKGIQLTLMIALVITFALIFVLFLFDKKITSYLTASELGPNGSLKQRFVHGARNLVIGFQALKQQPLNVLFFSILMWVCMLLAVYYCIRSVGLSVTLPTAALVMFVCAVGLFLPTAPGYVGTIQVAFALSLIPFGLSHNAIIAASLVYNLLITVPPLIGAGIAGWILWRTKMI